MQQEIEVYIKSTYGPEKVDLLIACFQVLEDYNLEDYEIGFMDLLMEADNKDPYQAQLEFELLVKNNLLNLLYIQGVHLNDEVDLITLKEISASLLLIQNIEDKQSALDIVEADFPTEEKLCELFQLVSIFSVDRFIVAIDSVDEGVFMKLREIFTEEIKESIVDEEQQDIINRLKLLKSYLNMDDAVAFKLIRKSVSVGMKFDFYFNYLKNKLDDMETDRAAAELVAMFTMSRDTYKDIIVQFSKRSNLMFLDLDRLSRVNVKLVKICSDFEVLYKTFLTEQKMKELNA